jgi:hypothetical protein
VFAISAARALYENTNLSAEEIVKKAMHIAGEMCIYTNHHLSLEKINTKVQKNEPKPKQEELKKEGLFKKKPKKEGKKK